MIDWASAIRPPIATPCTARKAIIGGTVCERPAPIEPMTKITMESWISSFLLNRSESLPQIGVVIVIASSDAVITQVYCRWVPFRSAMIVGSAVETMVDEIIAVNSAASRPGHHLEDLAVAELGGGGRGGRGHRCGVRCGGHRGCLSFAQVIGCCMQLYSAPMEIVERVGL